jgi:hypothetical protein
VPLSKQQILNRAVERLSKKPLAEQSLEEFCELFADARDLTYVFFARSPDPDDQVNEYGPGYLCGLELAACYSRGMDFRRPFPERWGDGNGDEGGANYRRQIQREVEARVHALRSRENTSYLLLWAIEGAGEIHCEHSLDYPDDAVLGELLCLFSDLMCEYIVL